jgi:hypothetical protein
MEAELMLLSDPADKPATMREHIDKIQVAINRLAAYEDTGLMPEEIMDGKMLTGWIPCSERLPEMFCTVLITAKLPEDKEWLVYEGARIGKRWELAGVANPEDYIVSAWQPLPEPWEGEQK